MNMVIVYSGWISHILGHTSAAGCAAAAVSRAKVMTVISERRCMLR